MTVPERPLRLGEVLAETVRLYGERAWGVLGVGAVAAVVLAFDLPDAAQVLLAAWVMTACFAAVARLASGDSFAEAWAQVALRSPVLAVLALVVGVPFSLGWIDPILLLLSTAWLAFAGFSIPIAVLERAPAAAGWPAQLRYVLERSTTLARAHYLHALGVAVTLVIVYVLFGALLGGLLVSFADNGGAAVAALVRLVLVPFVLLGLSVLYFEQRARSAPAA